MSDKSVTGLNKFYLKDEDDQSKEISSSMDVVKTSWADKLKKFVS